MTRPPVQQVASPAAITTPGDQITLEIDGIGRVQVGSNFRDLSPADQEATVNEIRASYRPAEGAGRVDNRTFTAPPTNPGEAQFQAAVEGTQGMVHGAAEVLDRGAQGLQGAYNWTLGNVTGQSHSADNPAITTLANAYVPEGSEIGRQAGRIGTAALLTRGRGIFTQGSIGGALTGDSDSPLGVAAEMALGGIGGRVADAGFRAGANFLAPRVSAGARYLYDRGVNLTPGQVIPGLRRWEEQMTSRPFVGADIVEGRQQGYRDFNRVVGEDVIAPFNTVAPRAGMAPVTMPAAQGHETVREVGNQLSSRYESIIPNLTLRPDAQLANDIQAVHLGTMNGDLTPAAREQLADIIQNQITPRLNGANPIPGADFRNIEESISHQIARFSKSDNPDHQAMAASLRQMQEAFQGALQRSNPNYAEVLQGLNGSWANLVRMEGAADSAVGGLFTPNAFRASVRRADASVRHRAMARGEARMQELADAGSDVLPPSYPDSGTSGRQQMSLTNPSYWLGMAERQLYGPGVQRGLVNAYMFPRPPAAEAVADALRTLPAASLGGQGLVSAYDAVRRGGALSRVGPAD